MGLGPIPATRKALEKAGWTVADLDQIEANEAFAAQNLSVIRQMENMTGKKIDMEKACLAYVFAYFI